jgi:hypothetical protein
MNISQDPDERARLRARRKFQMKKAALSGGFFAR